MHLSEINPHYALLQSESYVSPTERAWEAWCKKVEKLLGHDLDGNQRRDGYSLDYAHDAFADGVAPETYVAEVRHDKKLITVADTIARLTANCTTTTMEEECRRMGRLQELNAEFSRMQGDQADLEARIARELRKVEDARCAGEYDA